MTKIVIVNNSQTDTVKLRLKETADSTADIGIQTGAVHHNSPYLDIGLKEAAHAPAECDPTLVYMFEGRLPVDAVTHLDYSVSAAGHNVSAVRKRFDFTVHDFAHKYSAILDLLLTKISTDHPFIKFCRTSGNEVANFRFWTYSVDEGDEFYLGGAANMITTDPITITFIKSGGPGDLFSMLFPNETTALEQTVHSCGTQEFIGI